MDALLAAGITVAVITPRQVKNLRSRYGSAGNKDDRFDAYAGLQRVILMLGATLLSSA